MFTDLIALLTIENLADAIAALFAVPLVVALPLGIFAILFVEWFFLRLRALLGVSHAIDAGDGMYPEPAPEDVEGWQKYALAAAAVLQKMRADGLRGSDAGSPYEMDYGGFSWYIGKNGMPYATFSDANESYIPVEELVADGSPAPGDPDFRPNWWKPEYDPDKNPNWLQARLQDDIAGWEYTGLDENQRQTIFHASYRQHRRRMKANDRAQDRDYDELAFEGAV